MYLKTYLRDEVLKRLKYNLEKAQRRMVASANKRRELVFQEGDLVFLKLRPPRQTSLLTRIIQKLATKYFGSFLVLKKVGVVA
ncbi:hypothetical protein V2J09_018027 [Rumex salicifolius]